MKRMLMIFAVITIIIGLPIFFNLSKSYKLSEGFSNLGTIETNVLLQDSFPATGINQVSDKQPSGIWWQYPIFKVGSYDQITNNLRYLRNPDIGRCTPTDFCDAMYKDVKNKSNYITPLPPVDSSGGTRVGYFATSS
jgi:hypothetical protein